MTDQTRVKSDFLKNKKREKLEVSKTVVPETEIPVSKVKLEEKSARTYIPPQFYVLPAGGMHLAVPDLEFHNSHFANSTESLLSHSGTTNMYGDFKEQPKKCVNINSTKMNSTSSFKKESYKGSKLPRGLELTAGPGQKKMEKDGMSKKAPPPSQMLLESAAFFMSYFNFTQDKDPLDKGEASDNEVSVKNRMMGLWHNMKYGWSVNMKTNFSRETPIYLLGRVYHKTFKEEQSYEDTRFLCSNIEGFKKDFASLGWFTYRRKFPPLPESNLTTDCGWGCMIRSGQMMMHTALRRHFLLGSWHYGVEDGPQAAIHKQIMKFFCDDPSPNCPFSLHNLILFGHKMNKRAGSWYGPACVAHMFKDAVEKSSKHIAALERIKVYVAQDGAVYVQDILDMCSVDVCVCRHPSRAFWTPDSKCDSSSNNLHEGNRKYKSSVLKSDKPPTICDTNVNSSSVKNHSLGTFVNIDSSLVKMVPTKSDVVPLDLYVDLNREKEGKDNGCPFGDAVAMRLGRSPSQETPAVEQPCPQCLGWKSCVIFIPVRLGGTSVNPIYLNCIYSLFLHDLCIGIIGGKPKHSLYFVGFQDASLIHLDPHLSQEAVPLDSADYPLESYHCTSPRKLSISKMDPSATIGFYCHTRSQFYRLLEEAPLIATAKDGNMESPIFEFVDGRSKDVNGWAEQNFGESDTPRMSFSSDPPMHTSVEEADVSASLEEETEELVFE